MTRLHTLAVTFAVACALAVLPATACSPRPGYQVPTNLELAGDAEVILLGQVVSGSLNESDPQASAITVHPLSAIKGTLPSGDIELGGMMLARDGDQGAGPDARGLSNPYEFERAHPVSYRGACIRYVFPVGTTALFFLQRGSDGAWKPAGGAFSRWAEDVPGVDAPWVELSQLYVHAAALPEAERAAILTVERDRQKALRDDPLAQLIAADITRSLGSGEALADHQFEDSSQTESSVDATLEHMRKAGIEAGN